MGHYLIRRLLIAIPSLLAISVVLFTVLALAPGDPFEELATNPNVPPRPIPIPTAALLPQPRTSRRRDGSLEGVKWNVEGSQGASRREP